MTRASTCTTTRASAMQHSASTCITTRASTCHYTCARLLFKNMHPGDGYSTSDIAQGLQKALSVRRNLSRAFFKSLSHKRSTLLSPYVLVYPCNFTILPLIKSFKILWLLNPYKLLCCLQNLKKPSFSSGTPCTFPQMKRFKILFRIQQWGSGEARVSSAPIPEMERSQRIWKQTYTSLLWHQKGNQQETGPGSWMNLNETQIEKINYLKKRHTSFHHTAINPCLYKGLILFSEPPMWSSCAPAYSART